MENFTPLSALIGGALIGCAATLLLWLNGQIAGISGIFNSAFRPGVTDRAWRFVFLIGLMLGAGAWWYGSGGNFVLREGFPIPWLVVGGILVGFGTRLGSGCTSGHGVCGIGRLSPRSITATATFFGVALATTFVVRHIIGVGA